MANVTVLDWTAILISILALFFSIGSFWWMHWRTGKLRVGPPRSFVASSTRSNLSFQLPFIFFNDGPTPIFIHNLRLVLPAEESIPTVRFQFTVDKLGTNENNAMATQFPVRGREARLLVCWFMNTPNDLFLQARTYPMELQAIINNDERWKTIARFNLMIREEALKPILQGQLIAHDNWSTP